MRGSTLFVLGAAAGLAISPVHAQTPPEPTWESGNASVTLYGVADFGYVNRSGGGGAVPDLGTREEFQNSAGSSGTHLGADFAVALGESTKLIAKLEYGLNLGDDTDAGSGGDRVWFRQGYVGVTGRAGTVVAGTVEGARATVLKQYDPFGGHSVASAGSLQILITRADNAVAYISPAWNGWTATLAYTPDIVSADTRDAESPVYVVKLDYTKGPFSLSLDHEEEWWDNLPGFTRLKLNVVGASYDFGPVKLMGFYEDIDMAAGFDPVALGYFEDHRGYGLGATVPVGGMGTVKVGWSRRDSDFIGNRCDKYGVGYQHTVSARMYLYADYARIDNDSGGTCTIAYNNEQTSLDLGTVDAGGFGTRGVDFGLVLKF